MNTSSVVTAGAASQPNALDSPSRYGSRPEPATEFNRTSGREIAAADGVSSSGLASSEPKKRATPSLEQLQELSKSIQDSINIESRSLSFRVNEDINRTVVSVIDRTTDEIIKQIPSEEFVKIAAAISRLSQDPSTPDVGERDAVIGLLLNERV